MLDVSSWIDPLHKARIARAPEGCYGGLLWDLAYAWSAFVGLLRALWGRVRRRKDTCHDDYGNYPYYEDSEECPECGGEGWVDPHDPLWEGFDPVTCRKCRGTGYLDLPVGAPGGPKP